MASSDKKIYYQIDLKKEVGSTTWIYVQKGLANAQEINASGIILNMNTYGGTVVHADSIRTAILNSKIPFYAFIDNNAASAGALIAISCDSIYMKKGASMGAATVVNQTGEQMPDKYQSYMRSTIRSTAEAKGRDTVIINGKEYIRWRRDPHIAEAMVDERIVVPNVSDSGKVLTFTVDEAIKNRFCEGEAESVEDIIVNKLHTPDYELKIYKPSRLDDALGWLTSPVIQSMLIMVIVLGIFYELKTPGVGFPLAAALIAATLYFAPLYIEGLAQYWEILIFIVGLILLGIEIFVIPGFGIIGLLGIILISGSLILALVNNVVFSFEDVEIPDLSRSILVVVAGLATGIGVIIFILHRIGSKGFMNNMALNKEEKTEDGYIAVYMHPETMIGKTGISSTPLRPSGKIVIDDDYFDAVSQYGYIDSGKAVEVVRFENAQLYVIQKD